MKRQLFPTGNKHVRMDERGRECYFHPTYERWCPGHKERRCFVWDFNPLGKRFYDRPRSYEMADGTTRRVRKTRYTYEYFHRYDAAPVGRNGRTYGKALATNKREILYDGAFWRSASVRLDDGEWLDHTLVPFSGVLTDAYPAQSEEQGIPVVELYVSDGIPYSVVMDGERMDLMGPELPALYELLHMRVA